MTDEHGNLYEHDDHFADDVPHDHDFFVEEDEVEAYCMTCREKTVMEDPQPVWTRRGAPGLRGICSICGTIVFRMGRTPAHTRSKRPAPVQVAEGGPGHGRRKIETPVTFVNYSVNDAEFAEILAEDLKRIGIQTWLAGTGVDHVPWATGVHPSLVACKNMIVVLTALAVKATHVNEALEFFLAHNKPVVVVQLERIEVPDSLRRKPRFDFTGDDYKQQFRQLIEALTG